MDISKQIMKTDKYKEAEKLTEKEKLDYICGNMKVILAGPSMISGIVCSQCKNNFKGYKEFGKEMRQYMLENVCGNPCKKGFRFDSNTDTFEKVDLK